MTSMTTTTAMMICGRRSTTLVGITSPRLSTLTCTRIISKARLRRLLPTKANLIKNLSPICQMISLQMKMRMHLSIVELDVHRVIHVAQNDTQLNSSSLIKDQLMHNSILLNNNNIAARDHRQRMIVTQRRQALIVETLAATNKILSHLQLTIDTDHLPVPVAIYKLRSNIVVAALPHNKRKEPLVNMRDNNNLCNTDAPVESDLFIREVMMRIWTLITSAAQNSSKRLMKDVRNHFLFGVVMVKRRNVRTARNVRRIGTPSALQVSS